MGIQGLLPTLKSVMNPGHIRDFAGKRAAIDTYSWLHKAAFTCSKDICEGRYNDKYIAYCLHRINLLRHHGVQPVLVFDGGSLPMKSDQEIKRARSRKENLERAVEHERLGNHSAAYECYQKAVDITPAIAFQLIKSEGQLQSTTLRQHILSTIMTVVVWMMTKVDNESHEDRNQTVFQVLRKENVEYVVAPYEADAQMAFLALHGHVDLIITEDSDLIAYGCPLVFFKMDKFGQGVKFRYSDIVCNRDLEFNNFSKQMILEMCIMSGCDYLPSLPGMGVKRAHGLIKRFKSYQKVIKHLKFSGVLIDQLYEQGFERAILTFRHQRVYDPTKSDMVHLTEVPKEIDTDLEFLGPILCQTLATAIARGEVDPTTNKPFEEESGPGRPYSEKHSKSKSSPPKELELIAQKNVLTNYFLAPSEAAKKQFKAPRSNPNNSSIPNASQGGKAGENAPVPVCPEFSKFSLTHVKSPVLNRSLPSPFMHEELNLSDEEQRINDLASDFCRPSKRAHKIPGRLQNDENLYPSGEPEKMSKTFELRTRKTFVSPLLQTTSAQQITGSDLGMQGSSICGPLKRSGYFSRPSPSQLDPSTPEASEVRLHREKVVAKIDVSSQDLGTDTQVSERDDFSDHELHKSSDVAGCSIPDNGVVKKATKEAGPFLDAITARKRKHVPTFRSNLLGDKSMKSGSFTSLSHVGQYASLAQSSMDQFVSAIAPFRCLKSSSGAIGLRALSKHGTRASGLRAPSKSGRNSSTSRTAGTSGVMSEPLSQFAHNSVLNTSGPARRHSTPIAAGTVRWQIYNESDWESAPVAK